MSLGTSHLNLDPKDPWATAQSGYAPDKFYTRSTNSHDHSETLYVKVSPALFAALNDAVEKVSEYRTRADIVRDALIHRLHQVNEWVRAGINIQPIDTEVRLSEIEQAQADRAHWDHLVTSLDALLLKLVANGELDSAEHFIEQSAAVESMTEVYVAKLEAVIDKHRGAIRAARLYQN